MAPYTLQLKMHYELHQKFKSVGVVKVLAKEICGVPHHIAIITFHVKTTQNGFRPKVELSTGIMVNVHMDFQIVTTFLMEMIAIAVVALANKTMETSSYLWRGMVHHSGY
jgi:hypothetical protein